MSFKDCEIVKGAMEKKMAQIQISQSVEETWSNLNNYS